MFLQTVNRTGIYLLPPLFYYRHFVVTKNVASWRTAYECTMSMWSQWKVSTSFTRFLDDIMSLFLVLIVHVDFAVSRTFGDACIRSLGQNGWRSFGNYSITLTIVFISRYSLTIQYPWKKAPNGDNKNQAHIKVISFKATRSRDTLLWGKFHIYLKPLRPP